MASVSKTLRRRLAGARRQLSLPLAWTSSGRSPGPTTAVIATTLNCNARCVMCDIWKNRMKDELRPEELAALPSSLRDINLSGGEPFLRGDLPEMVEVLREACPDARQVISTNGFLPERIESSLRRIVAVDPQIGVRVSLDGMGEEHDRIRGVPGGFLRAEETLERARAAGVGDLGIGITLMDSNHDQVQPLYRWARQRGLELSVTVVTSSPIFFGEDKDVERGDRPGLARSLRWLAERDARSASPKRWVRAWFEGKLAEYVLSGERPIPCDAGDGFFYLDSMGTVYACHVRDLAMGNLRDTPFDELWSSASAGRAREQASGCRDCFMVCTSKSQISRRLPVVAAEVGREVVRAHLS